VRVEIKVGNVKTPSRSSPSFIRSSVTPTLQCRGYTGTEKTRTTFKTFRVPWAGERTIEVGGYEVNDDNVCRCFTLLCSERS
jgi:hypothetical protein